MKSSVELCNNHAKNESPIFVQKFNFDDFDKTLLNQVFEFLRYNCKIFLNILSQKVTNNWFFEPKILILAKNWTYKTLENEIFFGWKFEIFWTFQSFHEVEFWTKIVVWNIRVVNYKSMSICHSYNFVLGLGILVLTSKTQFESIISGFETFGIRS